MIEKFDFSKIEDQEKFDHLPDEEKKKKIEKTQEEANEVKERADRMSRKRVEEDFQKGVLTLGIIQPTKEEYEDASQYVDHDYFDHERPVNPELEKEVMEKIVDIFGEKNLKLRKDDFVEIELALKRGIITPYNRHFFEKVIEDENVYFLQRQRKIRRKERQIAKLQKIEEHSPEYDEYKKYSHRGNVFYPEGILNIAHEVIKNNFEVNPQNFDNVFLSDIPEILKMFSYVLQVLQKKGVINLNNIETLKKRFVENEKVDLSKLDDLKKELVSNLENIRDEWVRFFYSGVGGGNMRRVSKFTPVEGMFNQPGIVFDSDLDVIISFNQDYPTQATIRDLNNKKHIIGLMMPNHYGPDRLLRSYTNLLSSLSKSLPANEYEKIIKSDIFLSKLYEQGKIKEKCLVDESLLTEEENKQLKQKIRDILGKYSDLKPKMRTIDVMKKLSEKYKLPLYDLRGNLLWPREMKNEEVKEFIKEKR